MKIAVIRRECGNLWGGAERYCAQIIRILSHFGHQVTLIARKREGCNKEVDFIPIRYKARGSVLKNYLFVTKVTKVLRKADFDVVYGLSRVQSVDVSRISDPLHAAWIDSSYRGRLARYRVALSPRHRLLLSLENRIVFDKNVKIICNSNLVASQIEHYYGLPQSSSRLNVIYNGVDLRQFNPAVSAAGEKLREELGLGNETVLLFVGAEPKRKGFETLAKAISTLGNDEVYLLAVGLTKQQVSFRLPAEVEKRLFFFGRVNNPEIYYGAADLLVLPSRNDPFANVCLEAMACGTPVVTTTAVGSSEIINSGQTGFIMQDPQSHVELVELLKEYLSFSESKRRSMGEQAAQEASKYTWENHGKMLLKVFGEVLAEKT
jgi:UDP-glucose:(heptosyl)LPS alpha-1,3-glucosyltransferase